MRIGAKNVVAMVRGKIKIINRKLFMVSDEGAGEGASCLRV
jgi:hypothetical protein